MSDFEQTLYCVTCSRSMTWRSARQLKVGRTQRVFDIFQCADCGRFAWADLEPRSLRRGQKRRASEGRTAEQRQAHLST